VICSHIIEGSLSILEESVAAVREGTEIELSLLVMYTAITKKVTIFLGDIL
jgi:hypothetical protein